MLVIGIGATLGGIFDPPPGVSHESDVWGWALIALEGLLLWRSCRIGLDLQGSELRVRSWLRTRRVGVGEVTAVLVRPYDGLLTRGSQYDRLVCMALDLAEGASVTAWGLVGARGSIHRLARTLANRLDVPVRAVNKWEEPVPIAE